MSVPTRIREDHWKFTGTVDLGDASITLPDDPVAVTATPADGSVTTVKIADANVTLGKLAAAVAQHVPREVADPGDAGAIPVTASGVVPLVTEDAETRTLAAPGFAGQVLTLTLDTDGGDCVVTVAGGVNVAGNDTLTFDNAGETISLVGSKVADALVWRVLANDGVGLTTA
jgi:hypothetical protein